MPIPAASPKQPATSDSTVMGTVIEDRYRLERLLGSGGMSRVYLGTHVRAGGKLAIKLIDVRLSNKPDMMQRCLQEARTMMEIQSSHVVRAYDVGVLASGQLYIVMEYLAGLDLEQLLQRDGPLPWQRLAAMAVQICNGLATAHAHGTIHRDIKPQNCFAVTIDGNPDHIKLIDFGIARDANAESGLTQDGAILGTPEYMAPELVGSGMPPDARSDIYAVGATLYKMLTGDAPFRGRDALDTLYKHRNAPIVPPSKAAPKLDIPKEADAILVKALAKDPAQRYQSAEELAHAIRAAAGMPALGMRIRDPLAQSPIPRSPTARIAAHAIPRDLANNEASSPGRMAISQEVSTAEMRPVSMKELVLRGATLFSVSLVLAVASWLAAPSTPPPTPTLAVATKVPEPVKAPEPTKEPEPTKAPEPTKEPEPTKVDPTVVPPVEPTPDPGVKPPVDTPPVDTPPVDPPPVDPPPVDPVPTIVDTPPVDTPPVDTPPDSDPPIVVPDEAAGEPEPNFDYRSAKKNIDEQREYIVKTCLPKADKPTSKVNMRFDVRPGGRATVKVFSPSKAVRDCIREIFAVPFDSSPKGGAFLYFLTGSGGSLEKKPVDPTIVK